MFNFFRKSKVKVINVNNIDSLLGKIQLIDVRESYEFNGSSLKGAKNIPLQTLLKNPEKYLSKDKEYYLICQSGSRSGMACRKLQALGYEVVNVSGGIGSYVGNKLN